MSRAPEEVRQALLALFPPGDADLYAWDDPRSFVARHAAAIATAARLKGTDAVDELRRERRPQDAVAKLPDWERAFGLSKSRTTERGTIGQRQGQVVARWRENGASTPDRIRAAFAAVLGYEPDVLEHSRAALTAANTYQLPGAPITVPANASAAVPIAVADNAPVSQAGARLTLAVTTAAAEALDVQLDAPDGTTASWSAPFGAGAVAGATFVLYAPELAGARADGAWTLTVANHSGNAATLHTGSALFVEGIGRDLVTGAEGLGANIFEWAVLVDPARLTAAADLEAAAALVPRWSPAHARGYLCLKATNGSSFAVFDDPNTRFDGAVFGL